MQTSFRNMQTLKQTLVFNVSQVFASFISKTSGAFSVAVFNIPINQNGKIIRARAQLETTIGVINLSGCIISDNENLFFSVYNEKVYQSNNFTVNFLGGVFTCDSANGLEIFADTADLQDIISQLTLFLEYESN